MSLKVAFSQSCILSKLHSLKVAFSQSCVLSKLRSLKVAFSQSCVLSKLHSLKVAFSQSCVLSKLRSLKVAFSQSCLCPVWLLFIKFRKVIIFQEKSLILTKLRYFHCLRGESISIFVCIAS